MRRYYSSIIFGLAIAVLVANSLYHGSNLEIDDGFELLGYGQSMLLVALGILVKTIQDQ